MDATPLVSIIIPTRDRLELLLHALDSVRAQSYPNWECRIIDDGSTDGTEQAVRRISDARIAIEVRQSARDGANVCRNQGLDRATGKYLIFMDSDDLLAPHCLERRVAAMEADPSLDFAVFGIEVFANSPGDVGMAWNTGAQLEDLCRFLEIDSVWQTMAPIWRGDSYRRLGRWDESLLAFQDWELHIRALAMGLKYRSFSEIDCFLRMPGGREAISLRVNTPDYLRSHVQLLARVRRTLDDNGAMTAPRKQRLIGLYLWLADKFRRQGLNAESAEVWNRCRREKLIGPLTWAEGRMYLAGQNIPLLRRATRKYLLWRWPGEMIRKGSRTVMNIPLRPDAVSRPPRKLPANFYEFPA